MKTHLSLVMMLLLFALVQISSADEVEGKGLTVHGKVRVFAKADRATVTFDIKGVGKTLKAAFDDANTRIDSITEGLYAIGLSDRNISTTFFRSEENLGDKAFLSSKKDYRAIMTAAITTDSLVLLESVVIILSENEIKSIRGISFELVNYSDIRKAALAKATAKAKEKAELMCEQLGVRCGNAVKIEELRPTDPVGLNLGSTAFRRSVSPFNEPLYADYYGSALVQGQIASGFFPQEIRFDSEVKAVFEILGD